MPRTSEPTSESSRATSPKTPRRAVAEKRLLEAAAEIIAEVGPAKMTLSEIGIRAGYSHGLATHHFGSKGALIERLVDSVTAQFQAGLPGPTGFTSDMDRIQAIISTYFDILADFKPVNRARIALWADAVANGSPELGPAMIAMDDEFKNGIIEPIKHGVASGEFPASVRPEGFSTLLMSMLRGVALQLLLGEDVDLDDCRLEARHLVLARLSSEVAHTTTPWEKIRPEESPST